MERAGPRDWALPETETAALRPTPSPQGQAARARLRREVVRYNSAMKIVLAHGLTEFIYLI